MGIYSKWSFTIIIIIIIIEGCVNTLEMEHNINPDTEQMGCLREEAA